MPPLSAPVVSTVPRYPIGVVVQRVGLSEMTLRAWERRYAAIEPARSDGGHRLFSDADIERLTLLRTLTIEGTAISALASLETAELRRMAPGVAPRAAQPASDSLADDRGATSLSRELAVCGRAVVALDAERLHHTLMRLVLERGPLSFLEEVASPLCAWIGDEWARGQLNEAQERSASDVLRRVFGFVLHTLRRERRERHVVLATLPGEPHEFGAMMAGIIAAYDGWSYSYLGPDLPASAIAAAVRRLEAPVIAVSIVAPQSPAQLARDLVALRRAVGRRVEVVVGGPAAAVVERVLRDARATRIGSLRDWREFLANRP